MQSSFLLHLTNHGIRKGFSRLYMTSGKVMPGQSRFFRSITTTRLPSQIMHIFVNSTVSNITLTFHKSAATDFGKFIEPHRLVKGNGFRCVVCWQLNLANMAVSAQNGL